MQQFLNLPVAAEEDVSILNALGIKELERRTAAEELRGLHLVMAVAGEQLRPRKLVVLLAHAALSVSDSGVSRPSNSSTPLLR